MCNENLVIKYFLNIIKNLYQFIIFVHQLQHQQRLGSYIQILNYHPSIHHYCHTHRGFPLTHHAMRLVKNAYKNATIVPRIEWWRPTIKLVPSTPISVIQYQCRISVNETICKATHDVAEGMKV